jgi:hypothetical protein
MKRTGIKHTRRLSTLNASATYRYNPEAGQFDLRKGHRRNRRNRRARNWYLRNVFGVFLHYRLATRPMYFRGVFDGLERPT